MRPTIIALVALVCCTCRTPDPDTPRVDKMAEGIDRLVHVQACDASGSGVNLGNGRILTALHVAAYCPVYLVTSHASGHVAFGSLELGHVDDLAIIRVAPVEAAPPVRVASVQPGTVVCAMVASPEPGVRCGHVVKAMPGKGGIEHTVPTQKGNSGGGLYDTQGNLVGVIVTCNLTDGKCDGSGGGATAVGGMRWIGE